MKNSGIVIASLIGGMLIGSAVTMLFTPQSGPELRKKIKDLVNDELDRVQEKIGEEEERIDEIRCQCEEKKPRTVMEHSSSGGRFAVALLLFGISLLSAVLLLLTALLVWLTQAVGSLIAATLIVGGFFALLAAVVYRTAIRETLDRLRAQAETVYEVARAARSGYEWVLGKVAMVLSLRGESSGEVDRNTLKSPGLRDRKGVCRKG